MRVYAAIRPPPVPACPPGVRREVTRDNSRRRVAPDADAELTVCGSPPEDRDIGRALSARPVSSKHQGGPP